VAVSFTVKPAPCIKVPANLDFTKVAGVNDPPAQQIPITNCGSAGTWNAKVITNTPWLQVSPASGPLPVGATTATISTHDCSSGGEFPICLPSGKYTGQITFSNGPAQSTLTVTLTVTPSGPTITSFVGVWYNIDPNTRSWVRIEITAQGNTLTAHFFGSCIPTACDAGSTSTLFAGNPVRLHLVESFATRDFTLSLQGDVLHVTTFTHFTDNSGRTDYTSQDDFRKITVN
jgi:hypothetical protein